MEVRYLGLPSREEWQGVDWDADLLREAIDGQVGE